ncbi:MAG: (2Fe-2S)-binding protein [Candidatus Dormibacteraeota bacterium]|nr:(2Fe-2S)-binding protein [Candidatus Dormibacteraeota bacterium]
MRVNGSPVTVEVADSEMLLDTLRGLGLLSVREGCGVGACGACTVLVEGRPISSCLTRTARSEGADVLTLEGLGPDDPVRRAFREAEGYQCGYCTPGFILMTRALLAEHPDPGDDEVDDYLAGNLCRCGAYPEIREAVRLAQGRGS